MFALISGLVVGGVLLWLAVKDIDFAAVGTALRDAQLGYIFPMLGALALNYWLKAVRWQHLLAPSTSVPVPARALLPSMMVGIGANSILPAHLGELVRVYLAGTEFRIAKTTLLTTLVLERLLDVLSVVALLLVVLFAGDSSRELRIAVLFLTGVALAVVAVTIGLCVLKPHNSRLSEVLFKALPSSAADFLTRQIDHAMRGVAVIRQSHMYARLLVNSLLQWALMTAVVFFALHAFDISVPLYASIYILGLTVAGLTLPTSPGFVGTIQFCFLLGLRPFDVDPTVAFSASLLYHALALAAPIAAGVWFGRHYGLKWWKLKEAIAKSR
jgi:glycosyltransferase 2 family protein